MASHRFDLCYYGLFLYSLSAVSIAAVLARILSIGLMGIISGLLISVLVLVLVLVIIVLVLRTRWGNETR